MAIAIGEIKEGYRLVHRPKTVSLERMRGFSGWPSRNIHTDDELAKACGLPGPIASATMYQAYFVELMLDFFGEDWMRHGTMQLAFVRMVAAGDVLSPKAAVQTVEASENGVRLTLQLSCENQRGEQVAVGTAAGTLTP